MPDWKLLRSAEQPSCSVTEISKYHHCEIFEKSSCRCVQFSDIW